MSWWKLADRFFNLEMYKNAGYCYGRALKCDKNCLSLLAKKAQCYDRIKDTRGAIKYYQKIYDLISSKKEIVMKLAKLHSKIGQHTRAIVFLIEYLSRSDEGPDFDIANIVCEIMLAKENYLECSYFIENLLEDNQALDQLLSHYESIGKGNTIEIKRTYISANKKTKIQEEVPIDILIKYTRALMSMGESKEALIFLRHMEQLDLEEYLDIYLDLIEIYSDFEEFERALNVCLRLIDIQEVDDKSLLMLKIGILYGKLNQRDNEVEYYKRALALNPSNNQVRVRLSELYEIDGDINNALKILEGQPRSSITLVNNESEEVYRVDEEESDLGKRSALPIKMEDDFSTTQIDESKRLKVKRLLEDIKEEGSFNEKMKRKMESLVESNEEFFAHEQLRINSILENYNFEKLLLEFRKCEINLKGSDIEFIQSAKTCVLDSLKLEASKVDLETSIYNKLLKENKGKIKGELFGDNVDSTEDIGNLFIFKKKKEKHEDRFEHIFKDSKSKSRIAKRMSAKIIDRMNTIMSEIGENQYISILRRTLSSLQKASKYDLLVEICEQLLKLKKKFENHPEFMAEYYVSGFIANIKLENSEKAYIFFKFILKTVFKLNALEDVRKVYMKKLHPLTEIEISTLFFSILQTIFSAFTPHSSTSRSFFIKFKEQFAFEGSQRFVNHISACLYLSSGSLELLKQNIAKNHKSNYPQPLYDLMSGFCYLMESTNRTNPKKIDSIETAFAYFKKYEDERCASEEVYYNLARAFSHISCKDLSLDMLRKGRRATERKIIDLNRLAMKMEQIDSQAHKEIVDNVKDNGLYYNNLFNELVWHKISNNQKMEQYLLDNFLTFDEY